MVITTTMQRYLATLSHSLYCDRYSPTQSSSKCCCFPCNVLRLYGLQGTWVVSNENVCLTNLLS
nr:MAG TPA: hypothetical protein [Caudoviricetes sp.]